MFGLYCPWVAATPPQPIFKSSFYTNQASSLFFLFGVFSLPRQLSVVLSDFRMRPKSSLIEINNMQSCKSRGAGKSYIGLPVFKDMPQLHLNLADAHTLFFVPRISFFLLPLSPSLPCALCIERAQAVMKKLGWGWNIKDGNIYQGSTGTASAWLWLQLQSRSSKILGIKFVCCRYWITPRVVPYRPFQPSMQRPLEIHLPGKEKEPGEYVGGKGLWGEGWDVQVRGKYQGSSTVWLVHQPSTLGRP